MAENNNSFAKWLGRMWELYQLGKDLSRQRDLDAAEEWNQSAPERRQDFINWFQNIGNVLFAGHTQEREIKEELANATAENIENIISNFSDDFNSGQETVRPQEEEAAVAVKQYTDTSSIEGIDALSGIKDLDVSATDVGSYVADAMRGDDPATVELLKKAPLGRLTGKQFTDYKKFIEDGSNPEDAYEWVTDQKLTRFATDADGNVLFEGNIPVPIQAQPNSLFMNGRDGFINHIKEQNPQVIEALKDQMIGWGIADEDDFDDSGEVDANMETILGLMIDTANSKYSHITYGDAEWKALVDSVPANFGWVEDDNMASEKFSWAMLGKIMVDWRDIEELQADTATKAYTMGLKTENPTPGKSYMTLQLNQWFEQETGELPTQEQLTGYMEDWLISHDEYIQKSGAAYRAAQYGAQYEQYLLENGQAILPKDIKSLEDDIQAGGDVLTGIVGTREIATDAEDPYYTMALAVQTDLKTEKDRIEAAEAKRNNQKEVLKIMTGNI